MLLLLQCCYDYHYSYYYLLGYFFFHESTKTEKTGLNRELIKQEVEVRESVQNERSGIVVKQRKGFKCSYFKFSMQVNIGAISLIKYWCHD